MAMIEIKNLNKWYGNFQVLKNCNVTVEKSADLEMDGRVDLQNLLCL